MGSLLSVPNVTKQTADGEIRIESHDEATQSASAASASSVVSLRFGACSMQGWRKHQEDTFAINYFDENYQRCDSLPASVSSGWLMFSLFDGHGGVATSHYCRENFHSFLMEKIRAAHNSIDSTLLAEWFTQFDSKLPKATESEEESEKREENECQEGSESANSSGSSARPRLSISPDSSKPRRRHPYFSSSSNPHVDTGSTASLLLIDLAQRKFIVAHIGDSRVLVFRASKFNQPDSNVAAQNSADSPSDPSNISPACELLYVSRDHNPDENLEKTRLNSIISAQKRRRLVETAEMRNPKRQKIDSLKFLIADDEANEEAAEESNSLDSSEEADEITPPTTFSLIDSRIYTADHSYSLNVCRGFGDRNFKLDPFKQTNYGSNTSNGHDNHKQNNNVNDDANEYSNSNVSANVNASSVDETAHHAVSSEPDCFCSTFDSAANSGSPADSLAAEDSPSFVCIYLASDGVWNSVFPPGINEIDEKQEINEQIMQWTARHTIKTNRSGSSTNSTTNGQTVNHNRTTTETNGNDSNAPTPIIRSSTLTDSAARVSRVSQSADEAAIPGTPIIPSTFDWDSQAKPVELNRAALEMSPNTLNRADTILIGETNSEEAQFDQRYSTSLGQSLDYLIAKAPINRANAKQTDNMTAIICSIRIEKRKTNQSRRRIPQSMDRGILKEEGIQ